VSRPAKFIAAEAIETRVQLGADGRLPELSLRDDKQKPAVEKRQQSSNPLLLIGAVCISVTMSIIMLFVDTGTTRGNDRPKREAREELVTWYTGKPKGPATAGRELRPFEILLRRAVQAHHRTDFSEEQELYREVLDMLHDESNQDFGGLTGLREAAAPPNDQHLSSLLSILLSPE
jgi:hypothetical protein